MERALERHPAHEPFGECDADFTHYCAHCLAPADPESDRCQSCDAPFTGAGRFDRLHGPAPSAEFGSLFGRRSGATPDPAPRRSTLLALVLDLGSQGLGEHEVADEAARLVEQGEVVLTGNFAGCRLIEGPEAAVPSEAA